MFDTTAKRSNAVCSACACFPESLSLVNNLTKRPTLMHNQRLILRKTLDKKSPPPHNLAKTPARHSKVKSSEFYQKSRRAPHLLMVLYILMLMLTINKSEACSQPSQSSTACKFPLSCLDIKGSNDKVFPSLCQPAPRTDYENLKLNLKGVVDYM